MTKEDIMKRAEVLCAMDCVMAHLNDEDVWMMWAENGVPDGGPIHILDDKTEERRQYYGDIAEDCDDEDFEWMVKTFVKCIRRACWKSAYDEGGIV